MSARRSPAAATAACPPPGPLRNGDGQEDEPAVLAADELAVHGLLISPPIANG
ncbi:hypothetical protein ACGF0D_41885 [Kitasatospora sp. NPDC048298]|uniref:hypothetical protein n=1 Tax=Kitasatospora sp. NPDC048298 TaxID=3364049 RepID=UPI0037235CCB